ncbi:MAG TPA: sulfotransferase [Opitutaceae bacterium]
MAWLGASLLVAGFAVLCKLFGLVSGTRQVVIRARQSLLVLGDATLPDEAKEKALQAHALHLFRLFGLLVVGGAAALALPLAGLWGADRYGLFSWDEVLATTLSWPFLLISAVAMAAVFGLRPRRRPAAAAREGFENRYSTTEQWLHQIAFSTVPAQLGVADLEDRLHRKAMRRVVVGRPVFITALPRAGTTLLLECCAGLDEFASHTYRQMPFVLTPLLWERFSGVFRVKSGARERAHGDGMEVSVDSPEALEEVLWLAFWRQHYGPDRIRPWEPHEANPEFLEFFDAHIRKLALVTQPTRRREGAAVRYLSKNNANIARIPWLMTAFPNAQFVVPFREPLQHAASLRRQHGNFLKLHRTDEFARLYMAGIGHFDFGANLRPIDFANWLGSDAPAAQADGLAFWLRYWTAAYGRLLEVAEGPVGECVRLMDFDALCHAPGEALGDMAAFLEIRDLENFTAEARRIRAPKPHPVDTSDVAPAVLEEARTVHARLVDRAQAARGERKDALRTA